MTTLDTQGNPMPPLTTANIVLRDSNGEECVRSVDCIRDMRYPFRIFVDVGAEKIETRAGLQVLCNESGIVKRIARLPVLVDDKSRQFVIAEGEIVRVPVIDEGSTFAQRKQLMHERAKVFFRIADPDIRCSELTKPQLKTSIRQFEEIIEKTINDYEAAYHKGILCGRLIRYAEISLAEGLESDGSGASNLRTKRLFFLGERAYIRARELIRYVKLPGGHRGRIQDIDGILDAELGEVFKPAFSSNDFVRSGIIFKLAEAKRSIRKVGKVLDEVLAQEPSTARTVALPNFVSNRTLLRTRVHSFIEAALNSFDFIVYDGDEFQIAKGRYEGEYGILEQLVRTPGLIGDEFALKHVAAAVDLVNSMFHTGRAMPIRVAANQVICINGGLRKSVLSLTKENPILRDAQALADETYGLAEEIVRSRFYPVPPKMTEGVLFDRATELSDKIDHFNPITNESLPKIIFGIAKASVLSLSLLNRLSKLINTPIDVPTQIKLHEKQVGLKSAIEKLPRLKPEVGFKLSLQLGKLVLKAAQDGLAIYTGPDTEFRPATVENRAKIKRRLVQKIKNLSDYISILESLPDPSSFDTSCITQQQVTWIKEACHFILRNAQRVQSFRNSNLPDVFAQQRAIVSQLRTLNQSKPHI